MTKKELEIARGFGTYVFWKDALLKWAGNCGKQLVWRNAIISEITRHQSSLFFIHVFITGTSCGLEVWRRAFAPSSHLQGPIQRAGPGSWSYRQVGYCSWRLLKCRSHNGDSMFHWSRLGVPPGRRGQLPFQCARGVCVLPLLIPISWETGARRTRDWSEGSWTGISKRDCSLAYIE